MPLKMTGRTTRSLLTLIVAVIAASLGGTGWGRSAGAQVPAPVTSVCGQISVNTEWTNPGSPYGLTCPVSIAPGVTLTIDPGIVVVASAGSSLIVQSGATLLANEIPSLPVTFESSHAWLGIHFDAGASANSSLSYVTISNATYGVYNYPGSTLSNVNFTQDSTAAYFPGNASIAMQNDTFADVHTAINASGGSFSLTNDQFTTSSSALGNGLYGITTQNATVALSGVTMTGCTYCIAMAAGGTLSVVNSNIQGTQNHTVDLRSGSSVAVSNSSIVGGTALDVSNTPSVSITNSSITGLGPLTAGTNLTQDGTITIARSQFAAPGPALLITGGSAITISDSNLDNSGVGLELDGIGNSNVNVTRSNILYNTIGVSISNVLGNTVHLNSGFVGNSIYGNGTNVVVAGTAGAAVDAADNFWNTTDAAKIAASIVDCQTDATRPCVSYLPFQFGSPVTVTPVATATATATATITPIPTAVPTSTFAGVPSNARITLSPDTRAAGGDTVAVSGSGFKPGEAVFVQYTPTLNNGSSPFLVVAAVADAQGSFTNAVLTVPVNVTPGRYLVTATGTQSKFGAAAWLTVTPPVTPTSTPVPTATNTATPTATATPVPTNTPVPTATATATAVKKPYVLAIKYAYLWYHQVWAGSWNHVVVQANHRQKLDVTVHVLFPKGKPITITAKTDAGGHWEARFNVPRHTTTATLHDAVVQVQLQHQGTIKRANLIFAISG